MTVESTVSLSYLLHVPMHQLDGLENVKEECWKLAGLGLVAAAIGSGAGFCGFNVGFVGAISAGIYAGYHAACGILCAKLASEICSGRLMHTSAAEELTKTKAYGATKNVQ